MALYNKPKLSISPIIVKIPNTKNLKNTYVKSEQDKKNERDAIRQASNWNRDTLEPLSTIQAANLATGISTAVNAATSIYGAIQAGKMKPVLSSYQAPIEPTLVEDNSSAILVAGKENIDKSINTNSSIYQRNGITGMNGELISKENEGLNQLSASLAQYRTGIDTQNAQIQNQADQFNQSVEANREQFNAGTQNQFDQYKSSLIGMGMKNATDAITSGTESIFNNIRTQEQDTLVGINSEMSTIMQQLNNPAMLDPTNVKAAQSLRDRLTDLQSQKDTFNKSIYRPIQIKS